MNILGRTEPGGSLRTHLDRVPRGMEPMVLGYEALNNAFHVFLCFMP